MVCTAASQRNYNMHTAENLASELHKCGEEWGLDRPPVVSDNASNIHKAVRLFG